MSGLTAVPRYRRRLRCTTSPVLEGIHHVQEGAWGDDLNSLGAVEFQQVLVTADHVAGIAFHSALQGAMVGRVIGDD